MRRRRRPSQRLREPRAPDEGDNHQWQSVSAREPQAPDEGCNRGSSVAISEPSRASSTSASVNTHAARPAVIGVLVSVEASEMLSEAAAVAPAAVPPAPLPCGSCKGAGLGAPFRCAASAIASHAARCAWNVCGSSGHARCTWLAEMGGAVVSACMRGVMRRRRGVSRMRRAVPW